MRAWVTASFVVIAIGGAAGASRAVRANPGSGAALGASSRRAPLTAEDARRYMTALVNRDRASIGLPPVVLDDGAPTRAGQRHADDMAAHGYLGHWGTDGSVPEQRFTEAGGADMVLENASCFTDGHARALDPDPRIDPAAVERAEAMFFDERPPNDGHRRNILGRLHDKIGIGIAQPKPTPTEIPVPCFAQELVDAYGTYAPVPGDARVGASIHVRGTLSSPAVPVGVGLARVALPAPIGIDRLNTMRTYPVPAPYQTYWPAGYKTPIPVRVHGEDFAVDVPLNDEGRTGLYELSVWARVPGAADLVMVSLRTIRVR